MAQHEERALVLDIKDYRETSSILRVFAENEGRISLVAKGLRKPKLTPGTAALQPFNLVHIRYYLKDGATIGTLANAELQRPSSASRNSLEAYALISYWFEILKESSQERAALTHVFETTIQMLTHQDTHPGLHIQFLRHLLQFYQHLGFAINFHHCPICGTNPAPSRTFSLVHGGIICPTCTNKGHRGITLQPQEQTLIQTLTTTQQTAPQHPPPPSQNPTPSQHPTDPQTLFDFFTLLHRFLVHHLEHPLKTYTFAETTLKP